MKSDTEWKKLSESCNRLIYATQHIDYHRFFGERIKIQLYPL